jgi:hypothetical protein
MKLMMTGDEVMDEINDDGLWMKMMITLTK